MANDLVDPADLADFPGAPFTADQVDAAVANLRGIAEWHIAPELEETVTVDSTHDQVLVLPTLKIAVDGVTEVRDVTGSTPVILTDWWIRRNSMLARQRGWPCSRMLDAIEVDMTHGYEACPLDLLPVIAELAQISQTSGILSSRSLGDLSESYRTGGVSYPNRSTLARYQINIH